MRYPSPWLKPGAFRAFPVNRTEAVDQLLRLGNYREVNVEFEAGVFFRHTIYQKYRAYLLRDRELFARSYAQYIAQKCHNESLKSELKQFRRTGLEQIYHRQWSDADFAAIETALSALFLEMRWLL